MSMNQIFGSYYFDSPIVTRERYNKLLFNYFLPTVHSIHPNTIFQNDGAPPHYGLAVGQLLDENLICGLEGKFLPLGQLVPQV